MVSVANLCLLMTAGLYPERESLPRHLAQSRRMAGLINAALRKAEAGESSKAREDVASALSLASSRDLEALAALTLARTGDSSRAQAIVDDLERKAPLNVVLNKYWLPTVRALIN